MKNQKLNRFLLWILAIVVVMAINSCGARKVEKIRNSEMQNSVVEESSTTEKKEEANVKVEEKTAVNDKTKTKTTETLYKPVDPTKEASVTTSDGKKHQLNNAEILIKETEEEKDLKTDNSINSVITNKTELLEKSKSKAKTDSKKGAEAINTNRKAWSSLNLLWLLIPLGFLLAWLNKSKIITWAKNIWWI